MTAEQQQFSYGRFISGSCHGRASEPSMFRPGLPLPTLSSFLLLSALLIVSNLCIQRLSSARSPQFGRKIRAFTGNITRERPEHAACGVFMIDRASRRQNVSYFAFRAGMPADPRSCGPSSVQDQGHRAQSILCPWVRAIPGPLRVISAPSLSAKMCFAAQL